MEIDSVSYMKFVFALIFVLGLIGGFALLAKKFGMGNRGPMRRSKGNRLSIIESMALDAKRRVVLIRRDDKEHLLLLGGASEMVIEGEIEVDPERDKTLENSNDTASSETINLIDGIRHGLGVKK
jgi:flagellar protein FliO/FliZ|tara:strand:- start:261 stop:635 length:375 start_codon:yes stop_codon:yes gene_type:complete